jgi:opacity protein-like surface antigen
MDMDFRKLPGVLVCLLMGSTVTAAHASDEGFYVGAGVSRVKQDVGKSPGISFDFGLATPPDSIQVDTNKSGWNLTLGYHANRYLAGELTYTDFGKADVVENYTVPAGPFVPSAPISFSRSIRVKGPTLSVLGSLPLGANGRIFARGGILFAEQTVDQHFLDGPLTFGDHVLVGGIGAEYSFYNRWTARAEYQRTGKLESNALTGEVRLDQLSLSILLSL